MKMFRVLLVLLLAGCGGATAPAPSPTASPVAEVSPTPTPVVPLMDGFPTGFAPCARNAKTVKRAAYNCLRDWQPNTHPPAVLIYHFSPSVGRSMEVKVKKAAQLALSYSTPLLQRLDYRPTYHIFVNGEGVDSVAGRAWCKQAALSYPGTATQTWLWNSPTQNGSCTNKGGGGAGNPSTIPGHATAWITKGPHGWAGGEQFWASEILPAELAHAIQLQYWDKQFPGLRVSGAMQRWVQYLGPTALQRALRIRLNGADEDNLQVFIFAHGDNLAVTWQPTYHGWLCPDDGSPRAQSCGAVQDRPAAEAATPWNYTLYWYASLYATAVFGPDWINLELWPALAAEYRATGTSYYDEMDRVAYRLWGGAWSDIEEVLDTSLISELKAEGFTGLK